MSKLVKQQGKRAIVLCGGGSLGSYQLGAWKLLKELDIDYQIVTGTSIGSLNGAMMTLKDYPGALKLWDNISVGQIMSDGVDFDSNFLTSSLSLKKNSRFRKFLKQYLRNGGANIEPFKGKLKESVDPIKLKESDVDFGFVACSFPHIKELDFKVKEMNTEDILPFLHASCACFPIFPIEKINGKKYIDGGFKNNLPIDLAIEMGATEVIAILLDSFPSPQFSELEKIHFVTRITPTWPTGSMMSFSQDAIQRNMTLGYNDALKVFKKKIGYKYTFNITDEFDDIAKVFFLNLLRHNVRAFGGVDSVLKWRITHEMTDFDYFIRAIEMIAEYDGIDYLKIYDIKELIDLIIKNTREYENDEKIMYKYYKIKKGIYPRGKDQRAFIYYILYCLENNVSVDYLWEHIKNRPLLCVFLALLQTLFIYGLNDR